MRSVSPALGRSALCLLAIVVPRLAAAQGRFPPDSFTNLQVLPRTIAQRELIDVMRGFAGALGVRCVHCHVGRPDQPLDSVNFASDDKRTKRAAREMMRMAQDINERYLSYVPERPTPRVDVQCATCHRGLSRPRLLREELALALADSGLDATVRRYRQLRERYLIAGAYDFREPVLNELAQAEARAGRPANGFALLTLNEEFFPASGFIPFVRGEIYRQRADTAAALAQYRLALQRDSTNQAARQRIQALAGRQRP
jgi:hypothetical protein